MTIQQQQGTGSSNATTAQRYETVYANGSVYDWNSINACCIIWRPSIMASELKVDKFTGVTTAGSISVTGEGNSTTTNLQQGLCKCWAKYDAGSSLNDSFNVATLTDSGTGIMI